MSILSRLFRKRSGVIGPSFVLLDPRINARDAPYTFFLPSNLELAALNGGDIAQLMFEHIPAGEEWVVERMWVAIDARDGDRIAGRLDNDPYETTAVVRAGDVVHFAPYHVIKIRWDKPELAPPPAIYREFWQRCLVDDCVLTGEEPIEFIYREEPDMADPDDTYPDSGWRVRGRRGDADDAVMEARKLQYVAVGAVLNRDDSWLHLIDEPVGVSFMRDFGSNAYVRDE